MRRTVLRILLAMLLFAALQELALRVVFPLPEILNFDRSSYSHMQGDVDLRTPPLGKTSFTWASEPDGYEFVHRLNVYGFSDDDWRVAANAGVRRVAFFGDSGTEGFSTSADTAIPVLFEQHARADGLAVEALNLGVAGADWRAYTRLLRDATPLFRPDDVVLMVESTDLSRHAFDPRWLERPLEPVRARPFTPRALALLRRVREQGRLPRRWVSAPTAYLHPVPHPANPFSSPEEARRLEGLASPRMVRFMKRGRLSYGLAGMFPWSRRALLRPVSVAGFVAAVEAYTRALGARLLLVYLPFRSQVSDRYMGFEAELSAPGAEVVSLTGPEYAGHARRFAEAAAEHGVPFLDLTSALRDLARSEAAFWSYDDHLRPVGYRAVARVVYEWWKATTPEASSS